MFEKILQPSKNIRDDISSFLLNKISERSSPDVEKITRNVMNQVDALLHETSGMRWVGLAIIGKELGISIRAPIGFVSRAITLDEGAAMRDLLFSRGGDTPKAENL